MIKNIFKAIGCLSLVVTAFNPVLAQENQTPASVAKLNLQNIWMNNTNNAAGGVVDASKVYSISSFGIGTANGDFKMVQDGTDNLTYGISTEGGGVYEKLNNMFMWGSLSYTREAMSGTRFNLMAYDPFRDQPFQLADSNSSKWIRQEYNLNMKMASPQLFNFLTLGLSGSYISGLSAKQSDPVAEKQVSHFGWGASALMTFGKHNIGLSFNHSNRREDGDASIINNRNTSRVWDIVAPGFFREAEFGSYGSIIDTRYYHMHTLSGGLQYGFKNEHWNILLAADYMQRVEDINNERLDASPGTGRQMLGTVKEDSWSGRFLTNYTFNNGNFLAFKVSYENRSVDGIEYFQEFDNSYDVQAWIVKAKYIRSNISKVNTEVKLDYVVNDGNVYKWWFGANYSNKTNDWIYYLPTATQDVTNSYFGLFASRHIKLGKNNSLTINIDGGYQSNNKADIVYSGEGTQPDNAGWTDFTLKDFYYLTTNYTKLGGELSYSYSGFKKNDSLSLFLTASYDYYVPDSDDYTKRAIANFKIGLAF
ncbi:MAG: hypothetical protein IKY70_01960 [Bacteroidales bacterium]|nr:hypothetical protein [Bacteroidales bacterium]